LKILVIGAGGMIGHKMFQILKSKGHQVFGAVKQNNSQYAKFNLFADSELFDHVDVLDSNKIIQILNDLKPDVILNCVGITLRKPEIKDFEYSHKINTEFPHFLRTWAQDHKSYLIHFSTDCVFSGKDGPYTEESRTSAEDIYGRTKAAGEVVGPCTLTLRGSMIGRELFGKTELLEWALSQKNKQVKAFSKVIYSGVTTNLMAELVAKLVLMPKKLTGIYQVSSEPISKLELLQLIDKYFHLNLAIIEESTPVSSKILISEKLKKTIGFNCPSWVQMLEEISKDVLNYNS